MCGPCIAALGGLIINMFLYLFNFTYLLINYFFVCVLCV